VILKVNYFTSNLPASSFETDRKKFLGGNEYGSWAKPLSLQESELSNSEILRGDNISALLHHLGLIEPGGTRRLTTQLGQESSLKVARRGIEKFRKHKVVDAALEEMKDFWSDYLATLQVQTPTLQ